MKLHYDQLLTDPVTAVISFCDSKGNGGINGESCCFDTSRANELETNLFDFLQRVQPRIKTPKMD